MKRSLRFARRDEDIHLDDEIWKSEPGEPPIHSPGDLLAMMVQGGHALSEEHEERRAEERPTERPSRKAIISIHGQDVEECDIPEAPRDRRVA